MIRPRTDLVHHPSLPAAQQLARLVGRDGHEPRPHLVGLAQAADALPGLRPGDLRRLAGELDVAGDDVRRSYHRGVMLADEPRTGRLVAGSRLRDDRMLLRQVSHHQVRHGREMPAEAALSHRLRDTSQRTCSSPGRSRCAPARQGSTRLLRWFVTDRRAGKISESGAYGASYPVRTADRSPGSGWPDAARAGGAGETGGP